LRSGPTTDGNEFGRLRADDTRKSKDLDREIGRMKRNIAAPELLQAALKKVD
jgi:hypothetical protein